MSSMTLHPIPSSPTQPPSGYPTPSPPLLHHAQKSCDAPTPNSSSVTCKPHARSTSTHSDSSSPTKTTKQSTYALTKNSFTTTSSYAQGPPPALRAFAFRVKTPEDVDKAEAFFTELGCRVERRKNGFVRGIADAVRVSDPLGMPYEFFFETEHVERLTWAYDRHGVCPMVRLDHFNQVTPEIPRAVAYMEDLGFKVSENIQDEHGTVYAAWMRAKPSVHDAALTGGPGPQMHHMAFATYERGNIAGLCDRLGALRLSDCIERGPGRHGISNAYYLYLRDPDGHRIEIYTTGYYTGDPDNPVVTWDVHDNQRRDWWGSPVVTSWYNECSPVLDLDGNVVPLTQRSDASEETVTVGADGFSYTRKDDSDIPDYKKGQTAATETRS